MEALFYDLSSRNNPWYSYANIYDKAKEGGNTKDMKSSIRKILEYPHDITLYPGHGPNTTLKDEINNLNYYLDLL